MTHEVTTQRCPQCRHTFRVLADEAGDHPCPSCGGAPYNFAAELDRYLCEDISAYVAKHGRAADAFAFSTIHSRQWGRIPGAIIERLIDEELTKNGVEA